MRGLSTKVLKAVIMLTMYQIAIINLTCQIYKEFDFYYILKKIHVKTDLICLLAGAHASSTLITFSSSDNTPSLHITGTVRLMLYKLCVFLAIKLKREL